MDCPGFDPGTKGFVAWRSSTEPPQPVRKGGKIQSLEAQQSSSQEGHTTAQGECTSTQCSAAAAAAPADPAAAATAAAAGKC